MEDGFSLALRDLTVGIIGLGLMGGSLALKLKGQCAGLIGFNSHLPTLKLALSKNIVDLAETDPAKLLPQCDILILAVPVTVILDLIKQLPSLMPNPCIVMDLGSTKTDIIREMNELPSRFDPIGGHPICGKEKLGLENADSTLYQNAPFVITPIERTTKKAKSAAQQVISTIGANLIELTAEKHDRILASTSHLPFLISSALAHSISPAFASLVGPGFRSTSRLAGTPSHMMMGILKSNRENMLKAICHYRNSLDEIESALKNEDYAELESILNQSRNSYNTLMSNANHLHPASA